ncbi:MULTISPECIES: DUF5677 domain-containing protein [Methylomonas]|nr:MULTISPECIES: DUF5677 domain-containing protein [Methylomonas]TCV84518.1 hypothetical protein EDE11_107177 [Methylomonas methanica]
MMKAKEHLAELHDRCLELSSNINFDKRHALHFGLMSLYGSIVELVGSILILMNNNGKLGIRSLFRTFLETYVEFQNLAQDPKYGYYIDANDLKEWLKVLRVAAGNKNPYLADIADMPNISSVIRDKEQQLQKLKQSGYEPLDIRSKFKRAGMEEEYFSIYNFLCTESHSNKRALIERHADVGDNDYELVFYKSPPDEDFLDILDSAAGLLVSATIQLHEVFGSDSVSEAKLLGGKLKDARSSYSSRGS